MRKLITILVCHILLLQTQAQYFGGSKDGYSAFNTAGLTLNDQSFYCSGGDRDGYGFITSGLIVMNIQAIYCGGGNADGYDGLTLLAGSFYNQSAYCSGGSSDGYGLSTYLHGSLNVQAIYCSGGDKDGYDQINHTHGPFNVQSIYCSAGDGDGYGKIYLSQALFYDQSPYCTGGNRDGYAKVALPLDSLGNGIWTGVVSTDWNTPGNWANNVVPTVSDLVYVPTGCVFYPYLMSGLSINSTSQTHHCRSLEIQEGAQISTINAALSVNGRMVVAGDYTATNNINLAQNILSGGSLQILDDGIVHFGNQSTGSGLSDLSVLSGGTLEIDGGVLEVDDQLNIGGTFNMSSGYVFAHKYGAGSSITAISGPFVVSPGASGNISGGIVRVCGKDGGAQPAIALNDPDLDFTGSSILLVTNGISATRSDVTMKTANGAELRNLVISKPGYNVKLSSDMVINGQVSTLEDASLMVLDGNTVLVKGGAAP